jgi:hypothetical protein
MTEIHETIEEGVALDTTVIEPQPAHVMLDLETWDTGNDAVIVSIGACKFNADDILDRFHVAIDPASSQRFGLKIGAACMLWWLDPERDEARRNWLALPKVELEPALYGFAGWATSGQPIAAMWGNGSTFDNVILRSSYNAVGLEYPVKFWQDHCYRTAKSYTDVALVREGVHHNALDDAISQAKHLQAIWRQQAAAANHLVKLQDVMREYLPPDSGISEHEFANRIIGLLDGPEQRTVQAEGIVG